MADLALDIVTTAGVLFAVSVGLLIIFGIQKIISFAHGAFLTIGGYASVIVAAMHWNPWLALPVAFVVGTAIGAAVERVIIRPLYRRPLDAILATWGLAIVIVQLVTIGFGRGVQLVQSPLSGAMGVLGTDYSRYRLAFLGVSIFIGLLLALALYGTRLGLTARAVIMNEDLARSLGINSSRVNFITFSLGSGLASLAGALLTPLVSVDPIMGVTWLLNAFMLVLVAGSSLVSLAAACLVLGGAQVVVSTYGNPILGGLTIVVLAAIVLRVRPAGFARG
ncbi:MAG: branched-chain amino acid ABC transporter permease [Acetobacteraceae bacterium]